MVRMMLEAIRAPRERVAEVRERSIAASVRSNPASWIQPEAVRHRGEPSWVGERRTK